MSLAEQAVAEVLPAVPKDDKEKIQGLVALVDEYRNFPVETAEQCQQAADILSEAKGNHKALEDRRKLITAPLDAAKKSVMDLFRPATDALKDLEAILKPKIGSYHRKIEEQQRKEQAEAEEKARKERERLQQRADAARDKGQHEKADNLDMQAASTVATPPAIAPTKTAGVSVRRVWKAEVVDPIALCKEIAAGNIPPTVLEFKQAELNKIASTWQNNRQFEGLRIYQDSSVASR